VFAHHAGEGSLGEFRLDFFLPKSLAALAIEADDEELEFFLIARIGPALSLAAAPSFACESLGDGRAIAGVGGEEDLVAADDGAGGASAGELDFPEDVILGPLDGLVLIVRDTAA
jgi:hypothetical protein